MMLVNAFSYGAYLVIMKPITKKYQVITLMKWMFPMGVLMNLPFGERYVMGMATFALGCLMENRFDFNFPPSLPIY